MYCSTLPYLSDWKSKEYSKPHAYYILLDISEVPLCESAISCDNLLCDGHGRSPNPSVVVQISGPNRTNWIKYCRTEVIEVSSTLCSEALLSFFTYSSHLFHVAMFESSILVHYFVSWLRWSQCENFDPFHSIRCARARFSDGCATWIG